MPGRYGELVRRYRVAAGLTQEELAALSGLGVRTISDIERGRTSRPYRSSVDRLARALGRDDLGWEQARAHRPGPAIPAIPEIPAPGAPAAAGDADRVPGPQARPRQLPGGVRHFTGRADELAAMSGLLGQAGQERPGTVVITAIGGTAGVGKTALAVHWAHQVAGEFPDGQLYVNLRGYDPGRPVPASDALAGFLRAMGMPGQDIPAEPDERAARYRSLLAGRRMLVVVDNAGSEEQVRPLLPGSPACVTVVTSRDALAGLIARDGATRLDLDLLPLTEAIELLQQLIGERASADQAATAKLAGQCGRLPLALRVAAELAAAHPATSLTDLVTELASQQRRLDLLDAGGDPKTAIRAVFSWSCRYLDPASARAFRLAGLHPGPDLDHYAVAALTGSTSAQASRLLDRLSRAHLLHPATPGRYGMHDLLRGYACELADDQDGHDETRAALTRLFDHYLHTAAAAMDTLYPADYPAVRPGRPPAPRPAAPVPPLTGPVAARAWLDGHRASLVAAVVHAVEGGWPGHATRLAGTLFRYLDSSGHLPEAVTIHTCAHRAACQAGDRAAEADALTSLGVTDWRQGRHPQATHRLQQALALFGEIGDRTGEIRALGNLSEVAVRQGRYRQAADCLRQILALSCQTGDRASEARALNSLGEIDLRQGRYPQATRRFRQALALYRQIGHRIGLAGALKSLGEIDLRQGRYPQATRRLQRALATFRATGDRSNEANVLASLGDAGLRQGRHPQATRHFQQALALFIQTVDRTGEAQALNGLGDALLASARPWDARTQHATALDLASRIGDKHQQARAQHGIGHACLAAGDPGPARRHWQHALTLYARLGAPEAEQVRASLHNLDCRADL